MTIASSCRIIPTRIAGVTDLPVGSPTSPSSARANLAGARLDTRRDNRLLLQLPLQFPHECRQAGTALTLEPFRLQDRLNFRESFIDVVIDDDVVVLRPVAEFMRGSAHAGTYDRIAVLRAAVQPPFQIGGRWRQNEHAHHIGPRLLA